MISTIDERLKKRLAGESYDEAQLNELAQTILDRLCLRLGVTEMAFPTMFNSIAVDATVKAYRRLYYEGIVAESAGTLKNEFVADILAEYADEIKTYLNGVDSSESSAGGQVVFL